MANTNIQFPPNPIEGQSYTYEVEIGGITKSSTYIFEAGRWTLTADGNGIFNSLRVNENITFSSNALLSTGTGTSSGSLIAGVPGSSTEFKNQTRNIFVGHTFPGTSGNPLIRDNTLIGRNFFVSSPTTTEARENIGIGDQVLFKGHTGIHKLRVANSETSFVYKFGEFFEPIDGEFRVTANEPFNGSFPLVNRDPLVSPNPEVFPEISQVSFINGRLVEIWIKGSCLESNLDPAVFPCINDSTFNYISTGVINAGLSEEYQFTIPSTIQELNALFVDFVVDTIDTTGFDSPNIVIDGGSQIGFLSPLNNTAIGHWAGRFTGTGHDNTYIGWHAGENTNNGAHNVGIGFNALNEARGGEQTAIGWGALAEYRNGKQNVAIGWKTMFGVSDTTLANENQWPNETKDFTYAKENVAIGWQAAKNLLNASQNVIIGWDAYPGLPDSEYINMVNNIEEGVENLVFKSKENVIIGWGAAQKAKDLTQTTIIGWGAGKTLTGGDTVCIGWGAANQLESPVHSTFIGWESGRGLRRSSADIYLGWGIVNNGSGKESGGNTLAGYGLFFHATNGRDYGNSKYGIYGNSIWGAKSSEFTHTSNYNSILGSWNVRDWENMGFFNTIVGHGINRTNIDVEQLDEYGGAPLSEQEVYTIAFMFNKEGTRYLPLELELINDDEYIFIQEGDIVYYKDILSSTIVWNLFKKTSNYSIVIPSSGDPPPGMSWNQWARQTLKNGYTNTDPSLPPTTSALLPPLDSNGALNSGWIKLLNTSDQAISFTSAIQNEEYDTKTGTSYGEFFKYSKPVLILNTHVSISAEVEEDLDILLDEAIFIGLHPFMGEIEYPESSSSYVDSSMFNKSIYDNVSHFKNKPFKHNFYFPSLPLDILNRVIKVNDPGYTEFGSSYHIIFPINTEVTLPCLPDWVNKPIIRWKYIHQASPLITRESSFSGETVIKPMYGCTYIGTLSSPMSLAPEAERKLFTLTNETILGYMGRGHGSNTTTINCDLTTDTYINGTTDHVLHVTGSVVSGSLITDSATVGSTEFIPGQNDVTIILPDIDGKLLTQYTKLGNTQLTTLLGSTEFTEEEGDTSPVEIFIPHQSGKLVVIDDDTYIAEESIRKLTSGSHYSYLNQLTEQNLFNTPTSFAVKHNTSYRIYGLVVIDSSMWTNKNIKVYFSVNDNLVLSDDFLAFNISTFATLPIATRTQESMYLLPSTLSTSNIFNASSANRFFVIRIDGFINTSLLLPELVGLVTPKIVFSAFDTSGVTLRKGSYLSFEEIKDPSVSYIGAWQ